VVAVGLERVESDKGGALKGKKAGLVAHAASVTADGRHAIDVLKAQGVELVRVFSPEHGLRGRAAAGEKVKSDVDAESKLPVVSLYGDSNKPSAEDLKGLDVLIFDLQDGGVRFYTYVSTMILCLEAAADAGIEFVVLDRPNPLGGLRVEGPLRDATKPTSLVSMAPGPLVHGLTAGEMARFVNGQRAKPGKVTVVSMTGWKRPMTWLDTGRPWVNPSPNLRSAEAALAYPGTCLLEATNVSEGRGTESPFVLLGAPWLAKGALDAIPPVPGFGFEPAVFSPAANPGAPAPRYAGQECHGLRVKVAQPQAAEPYRLGLTLLSLLRSQQGFEWRDGGAALDRLLGTSRPREALLKGQAVETIVEQDAKDIAAFRKEREKALLY
jgi:uncharacterized protein YbbC (DUF1343 family)